MLLTCGIRDFVIQVRYEWLCLPKKMCCLVWRVLFKCTHCIGNKTWFLSRVIHLQGSQGYLMWSMLMCMVLSSQENLGIVHFVTFIYDHSRKIWIYMLKTNDKVLGIFKQC